MFTDRFIKVPIEIVNTREAELIGDEDSYGFLAYMYLNPLEILSFRPKYDDEENETDKVVVDFKNGDNILIFMPIHEFESLLNHFGK